MNAAKCSKRAGDNAGAAAIILADQERHGGDESLAVRWARLWLSRHPEESTPRASEPFQFALKAPQR